MYVTQASTTKNRRYWKKDTRWKEQKGHKLALDLLVDLISWKSNFVSVIYKSYKIYNGCTGPPDNVIALGQSALVDRVKVATANLKLSLHTLGLS